MALRTVGVRLAAEVSSYVNTLRTAKGATRDFVGELDRAAKAGHLDAVADQAGRMGLGLAAGFGAALAVTAKFDKQMSEVGAVSNATGAELEQLRQAALAAGKATSFGATEAAKAQAELAKAGLSTSEILSGALSGSLSLAAAGSLDLAEAADVAAKTMNVFELEGSDVGHIADVLASAANKSATDVHEMGEALKMGGLASQAAGMSLEETVGTLAAFADNALSGSDAGTSLKTALMMLQAPTDKAAGVMEDLGISAYDAGGNFVGTAALAGQLQRALGPLTQEQRNAALATIFGADAMRAANVLYSVGEQGIKDYTAAVDDQGAAAEVAAAKTDNLMGDIERLTGSLETMAIEASSSSSSGLRTIVQAADRLIGSISGIPAPVQNAGVAIAAVGAASFLAAAGAIRLRNATSDALGELSKTGPMGAKAAVGLERAAKGAQRAGVALVALQVAGAVLGSSLNPQLELLADNLGDLGETGKIGSEAARLFGDDLGMLDQSLKAVADTGKWSSFSRGAAGLIEGLTGAGNVFDDSLQKGRERIAGLDAALTQLVQSGKTAEAAAAFAALAKRAAEQGISVNELNKALPGYAAAVQLAGQESATTAGAVGAVGLTAEEAAEQVKALKEEFDRLFGVQMDLDRATIEYKEGLVELKDELTNGKRTLDTNSQAGRDNATAVLDQIDRIKTLRDARIEHGETLDVANGKYVKDIDGLRKTMLQAGYTKTEVDALIGKYREIPGEVKTTVAANTKPAVDQVAAYERWLKSRNLDRTSTITERRVAEGNTARGGNREFSRWGGIYAAEGLLRDAHRASPVGTARYGYAEQATGGELFAPKYGDMEKTRSEVGWAVENWWGGRVQWHPGAPSTSTSGTAATSGGPIIVENHIEIGGEVVRVVRTEVSDSNRALKRRVGAGAGTNR